jgi:hypothetical protein
MLAYNDKVRGMGTLRDDNAMYNGADNSANGGGNYTGGANPMQAITNFVAKAVAVDSNLFEGTANRWCDPAHPTAGIDYQFASNMARLGKRSIQYEGGTNWKPTYPDPSFQVFKTAVTNSSQWAIAQINYFNARSRLAGASMPAVYFITSDAAGRAFQWWSYASPDTYASGVEGQALENNSTWVAMGNRNRALWP